MNGRERGFLLLSSHLGDPDRKSLTVPQLRELARRMQGREKPEADRDLTAADLRQLGYDAVQADRIVTLLEEEDALDYYLRKAAAQGCAPLSRVSEAYPLVLRKRLGLDAPACLWVKGDLSLLREPTIALVGSRNLREDNRRFAEEAGRQTALQGYTLVSGNARGADKTAQESCLAAGGKVICVVADELTRQLERENVLYISEDGFEEPFSAQRALSRNRVIHGLGLKTLVAQSSLKIGGTWDGTVRNLRFGYSPVFCYDDGSEAMTKLAAMGAVPVGMNALKDLYELENPQENIFDR